MKTRLVGLYLFLATTAAAQTTVVPFEYYQSLIYIRATTGGKSQLRFLVNTGANASVLDARTAASLRLTALEQDSVVGTVGREAVAILRLPEFRIGTLTTRNMPVTRRDLGRYLTPDNRPLDGVLGTDFLSRYAVTIDYRAKTLTLAPAAKKGFKQKIPFTLLDGTPVVQSRFNDTLNVPLYVNTGVSLAPEPALYFNISEALWRDLKKHDPKLAPVRHLSARGVGGTAYLPVVPARSLMLGRFRVLQPQLIVQPDGGYFQRDARAGFFGNNLLEKYQKVTLDFPARNLAFNPPPSYGAYLYEQRDSTAQAAVRANRRGRRTKR